MKMLNIAPQLSIPVDAVTQTFAILGIRGSGKTTTAVVIVEELLKASQQVVILDPVDVWHGLRSAAGGKSSGFPVTILGGDHADLPLEASSGAIIADFVVDSGASIVLSLRHMSMNDQRRFAADFAERLYSRKGEGSARSPLHLVIDEADAFVPQRIPPGGERMFGAFDRIVRRGRAAGLGVTMISQRAQIINKDVLSQIETLICHRVLHKLDRKALEAWIEAHDVDGKAEEFLQSLAALGRGDAWIWSPEWLGIFKRVHIRARDTFDSSSTPKAGEKRIAPKQIAPVDLDELRAKLAATIERAKADNPAELRRHIADLKAQLAKAANSSPKQSPPVDPAPLIAKAVKSALTEQRNHYAKAFNGLSKAIATAVSEHVKCIPDFVLDTSAVSFSYAESTMPRAAIAHAGAGIPGTIRVVRTGEPARKPMARASNSSERLPEGEYKILTNETAKMQPAACRRRYWPLPELITQTLFPLPAIAPRIPAFTTLTSNKSWEWRTPGEIYSQLDDEFHFTLDPCPIGGLEGLTMRWSGQRVFCNPPYGPIAGKFLRRWRDADLAVYLLPARTDTKWFHEIVLPHAGEVRFIKGRLCFSGSAGRAPFPSMVVIFHPK